MPDELWTDVLDLVQETGIKTIPMEKKCQKAKWLSEEALQIPVKRREAKSKGEKERYLYDTPTELYCLQRNYMQYLCHFVGMSLALHWEKKNITTLLLPKDSITNLKGFFHYYRHSKVSVSTNSLSIFHYLKENMKTFSETWEFPGNDHF